MTVMTLYGPVSPEDAPADQK